MHAVFIFMYAIEVTVSGMHAVFIFVYAIEVTVSGMHAVFIFIFHCSFCLMAQFARNWPFTTMQLARRYSAQCSISPRRSPECAAVDTKR